MTSHTGRLYALAVALVAFFLAWAVIAAHPWATATADPRLQALAARETQLRSQAKLVSQVVAQRWTLYRSELHVRQLQIAAAKTRATQVNASYSAGAAPASASSSVRVVTLPPLTITRTS